MRKIIFNQVDKFNTYQISYRFLRMIKKEELTYRSLIPCILKSATKKYDSDFKINRELDQLYGASVMTQTTRMGETSIVSFSLSFVDPNIVNDNNYSFTVCDSFLKEIIYNPLLENDAFKNEIVNREKESLSDEIDSQIENKSAYASNKLYELFFEGTIGAYRANGYKEDLPNINSTNLYQNYKDMIEHDDLVIIVSGNITDEIRQLFNHQTLDLVTYNPYVKERNDFDFRYVKEKTNSTQSVLTIGYDCKVFRSDDLYPAFLVFNKIFGSGATSYLFQEVREKRSLCYNIFSDYSNVYGMMLVYMGIKGEDSDKCIELVDNQINRIINNDFTVDMIKEAVYNLKNSFISSRDDQSTLLTIAFNEGVYNIKSDLEALFNSLDNVSSDDIVKCAKLLKKKASFLLLGGDINE